MKHSFLVSWFSPLALAVPLLGGCGDDGGQPDAGGAHDASSTADAGPGAASGYRTDLVGSIQLIEYAPGGSSAFAYFQDGRGTVPAEHASASEGDCTIYLHPPSGLCEEQCAGFCNPDGTCTPPRERLSAGTITITGLEQSLALVPGMFGYQPEPTPGEDLFRAGAAITATAAGDEDDGIGGFTIEATGVASFADEIPHMVLVDGEDHEITWTPATEGEARIQLALRFGWHGAPYTAMLLCDSADDGSLIIPGGLIAELPMFGGIGLFQHLSEIARYNRIVVELSNGPVELFVASHRLVSFEHGVQAARGR